LVHFFHLLSFKFISVGTKMDSNLDGFQFISFTAGLLLGYQACLSHGLIY
jgi:hypothetical protein